MIVTLEEDGRRREAKVPYEGADHVVVTAPCPACGGFKVRGSGPRTHDHDTHRCPAACLCGHPRGVLKAKVSTIFGIEEDERVLNGRCRVY